jgi:hypothetical protein
MKFDKPSKEHIGKAKLLSREDAERLFARMRKRYQHAVKDGHLDPLDAAALQLAHEDEQLEEWRAKIAKLKKK